MNSDFLLKIISLLPFVLLWQWWWGRRRIKFECGYTIESNSDGIGNYLAFYIKAINPSKYVIFLERLEAIDSKNELYYPLLMNDALPLELNPGRNAVFILPCGHVVKPNPKSFILIDELSHKYQLNGKVLRVGLVNLQKEYTRQESLGLEVHPRR